MSSGSTGCGSSAPRTFRALINHFGGAHAALEAVPALARRGGSAAPQICSRQDAEREIEASRKLGATLVAIGEADYPRRLQMIDDPPPLIAIRGRATVFAIPQVAIVGSRNASAGGVKLTQRIAHGLCEAGFAIVSRPRAGHRRRRTPREPFNRHGRGPRRRS